MLEMLQAASGKKVDVVGQMEWTTAGTYDWIVPAGVNIASAFLVGGGGNGFQGSGGGNYASGAGGGGGTIYANEIPLIPGETLTIKVGTANLRSEIIRKSTLESFIFAYSGSSGVGYRAGAGGQGGVCSVAAAVMGIGGKGGEGHSNGDPGGGGGAAGYGGIGGDGGEERYPSADKIPTVSTTGGGGGGRVTAGNAPGQKSENGGGVGLRGQGSNGSAGRDGSMANGGVACGAGGGGGSRNTAGAIGKPGGVRIIWGNGRAYPSTRTADEI